MSGSMSAEGELFDALDKITELEHDLSFEKDAVQALTDKINHQIYRLRESDGRITELQDYIKELQNDIEHYGE